MKISLLHSGCGDWVGMYVDGNLVIEDHRLRETELLHELRKHLNFDFENLWSKDEYLDHYGNSCPDTWQEVIDGEKELE